MTEAELMAFLDEGIRRVKAARERPPSLMVRALLAEFGPQELRALAAALEPYRPAVNGGGALLSIARVAAVLDCSTWTVRRRIAASELPAIEDHGRLMVRGDDLCAYIEGLAAAGPLPPRRRQVRRRHYPRLSE